MEYNENNNEEQQPQKRKQDESAPRFNLNSFAGNPFFNLLDPFLNYIDRGRFFRHIFYWIYVIFAVATLLVAAGMLIALGNTPLTNNVFLFILIMIVVLFTAWIGFMIWWNRKDKVFGTSKEYDDFVVIPVFSHFLQTLGEYMGAIYAILGFGLSVLVALFLDSYTRDILYTNLLPNLGLMGLISSPVIGFLIMVTFRVIAEMYSAIVAIANNTKNRQ